MSLTTDASLSIALSLMSEDREVVPVHSPEDVASLPVSDFDVAMIDLGTTSRGLAARELLEQRGITAPCLVLGDHDSPPPGSGVIVLPRPFTLEQLDHRLGELGRAATEASQPPIFTARAGTGLFGRMRRRRHGSDQASRGEERETVAPTGGVTPTGPGGVQEVAPGREGEQASIVGEKAASPTSLDEDVDVSREETLVSAWTELIIEAAEDQGAVIAETDTDRTSAVGLQEASREVAVTSDTESQPTADVAEEESASPKQTTEVPNLRAPRINLLSDAVVAEVTDNLEASREHDDSPEATVRDAGEDAADEPVAPAAADEFPSRVEDAVDGRESIPRPLPHIYPRFRGEGQRPGADRSGSLSRMLVAGSDLETLLDQMPHLVDRTAVATGVLREVEQTFAAAACQLWVPSENGAYELLAGLGVDEQAGLRVQPDQSLFLSFEANLEAILVSPLDPAQRPVAGIPALVGDALLGSALRVDDVLHGVVLVMGSRYVEEDLDRLWALTAPAAPLLALATLITRLRDRRFITLPSSPEREVEFFSNL